VTIDGDDATVGEGGSRLAGELGEVLAAAVAEHGVPGAAAGVLVDGATHVATVGVTNAEHPAPVEAGTLFQVGSVTKTLTAAAVALLAEEGRLGLDDPVDRHLPDLAAAVERAGGGLDLAAITVEHLLSHRSGIDGDWLFTTGGTSIADLAAAPVTFPPGAGYSYSNAGFTVAGAVVEAVTGEPVAAVVRDRLLRPLGLATACFTADEAITHSVAAPHWVFDGQAYVIRGVGWQPGWQLGAVDHAAGGLIASVPDLLAWGRAQLDGLAADGSMLLPEPVRRRLHTPVVRADRAHEIALDWFVEGVDGTTLIGHGGLTAGYATDLVIVPDAGVVVAVAVHATNGGRVAEAVRRWALERHAGLVERDPEADPAVDVDLDALVGTYRQSLGDLVVEPGPEPGTLTVTTVPRSDRSWQPPPDPVVTLAPADAEHLVMVGRAGGPIRLVRFAPPGADQPGWLLWGERRVTSGVVTSGVRPQM